MTRPPEAPEPDEDLRDHMERCVAAMRARTPTPWSSSAMPDSIGPEPVAPGTFPRDRLGALRIDRRLGAGGMGEVFAATHTETGARVALKVLRITSPTLLYRFKREFRALAGINHPNVASLHELFVSPDGPAFFTMELVEGRPFTTYVRRGARDGGLPDLVRLEAALLQLVRGVHHLHRARCIHRDLKPPNVLVTAEGRVVILDFGLVSEQVDSDAGVTGDGQLLGTPAYMAPEQANAETGPAVDYYAIGVMLYQCLTGMLPFSGGAMRIILLKQDHEAPDPAAGGLAVPEHLRQLCRRLLQRDPALRPTGRELLELLEGAHARSDADTRVSVGDTRMVRRVPFVGRDAEQQALQAALREVAERGSSITVHVHGPSGHGKSALVARLLTHARSDERSLVLGGRCFERVWVPYKGVDTVVDALSVHLRRMTAEQRAEARPRHLAALTRMFPVLAEIWTPAGDEDRPTAAVLEPSERLRLGLAALREVFVRLGARWTLVVLIDDLQWSNLDGVELLTSIMRPPDSPAMLLVLAFRDERPGNPGLRALTEPAALAGRDVRELELGPLSDEAALELARALVSGGDEDPTRVQELVQHAHGSPAVIRQRLADDQPLQSSAPAIDRIAIDRLPELAAEARRILACVAVANGPVPLGVVAEVAASVEARRWVEQLSAQRLLRITDSEAETGESRPLVEPSDEWIREAVRADLDGDELRALHRGLATALERVGAEPETLAEYYAQGGEPGRAASCIERAAEQAAQTLASPHAVDLYRRALELLPPESTEEQRQRLLRGLARQLVLLGHGAESAGLLLELASRAADAEARALRREAARALARSGHIDQAIALVTELLDAMGEPVPRTRRHALASLAWARLRLWLRGLEPVVRAQAQVPLVSLERLDTLLAVVDGLPQGTLARVLHARALPLALDVGEPRRLGKVLGHEISRQVGLGRLRWARALVVEARELAAVAADAELDLELDMATLDADGLAQGYPWACERLGCTLARADEVPAAGWIRAQLVVRRVEARIGMGSYAQARRELPGLLASARDRGSVQEVVALEAHATTIALRYDDLAKARRHLAAGRSAWEGSRYTLASATLDNAEIELLLCAGELEEAAACIARERLALRRAGLDRVRRAVELVDCLHARCSIQGVLRQPTDRSLVARVRAMGRRLRRSVDPTHRGQAMLGEATLRSLTGDVEGARRAWRSAHACFEALGMGAHLAATCVRLAEVTSAHESRRLAAAAAAYFAEERIGEHGPLVESLAPAAPLARSPP
jgi:hypothetical protein